MTFVGGMPFSRSILATGTPVPPHLITEYNKIANKQLFLVFYDYDTPVVTPQGQFIINAAAANFLNSAFTIVHVIGYADTYLDEAYALQFTGQIANTVARALVDGGIPAEVIKAEGRGEQDLRIPTPPGVRQPQNRRVEITFE